MKRTLHLTALLLLMGAATVQAQSCCQQKAEGEKGCCKAQSAALQTIMTRTSVRQFQDKAVEPAKVEALLRAAMAAPTAMNKQPWHFVVVDQKAVLDSMAGPAHRGDMMRKAPLAIVVCGDFAKAGDGERREFWIQDTSAATENMLLAAHAMGLGAVWTSAWPQEQKCANYQRVLGLPSTVMPLCVVLVGYPAEEPQPKDKWNPANVSYNHYGSQQ